MKKKAGKPPFMRDDKKADDKKADGKKGKPAAKGKGKK